MARPLFDSEYIFGLHEPGGEHHMKEAGKLGWILFTEAIGHDPNNHSGKDFSHWSNQGYGVICRLNNGYEPEGTIPNSGQYTNFARRCANYVAASQGCKIWIIGNEMNYSVEWPPLAASRSVAPTTSSDALENVQPHSAPLNPVPPNTKNPNNSSSSRGYWHSFLRWISQGMGDAELFNNDGLQIEQPYDGPSVLESSMPPQTETSEQLDDKTVEQLDPFHRDPKQRFTAIYGSQSAEESIINAPGNHLEPSHEAAASRSTEGRQPITPQLYALCYRLCRDAIHRVSGHSNDQVLVGAPAPWNVDTKYASNPNGDWIIYFRDILNQIGAGGCDGITIHTYTHGVDPNLINDTQKMNPPFQNYHFHFYTYKDFMNAVPSNMRHLPMYVTETDQNDPWQDQNHGWVQRAYGDIDHWNRQAGNQQIRSLILYRWPKIDRWFIEGKQGVIDDFRTALRSNYRWNAPRVGTGPPQPPRPAPPVPPRPAPPPIPLVAQPLSLRSGDKLLTFDIVNLRRTAGYLNHPASDVIQQIQSNTELLVLATRPLIADGLVWWFIRATVPVPSGGFTSVDGWVSQNEPNGNILLRKVTAGTLVPPPVIVPPTTPPPTTPPPTTPPPTTPPPTTPLGPIVPAPVHVSFQQGDNAYTLDIVRLRRTPGFRNKSASDVVSDVRANTAVLIIGGPRQLDGLTWWQVETKVNAQNAEGWMAAAVSSQVQLLAKGAAPELSNKFVIGSSIVTNDIVRMRRTPGFRGKPINDVVTDIIKGVTGTVLGGPRQMDNLTWWQIEVKDAIGRTVSGWMAEETATGIPLLLGNTRESSNSTAGATVPGRPQPTQPSAEPALPPINPEESEPVQPESEPPESPTGTPLTGTPPTGTPPGGTLPGGENSDALQIGDMAVTTNIVRMRKTVGFIGKPESDLVADIPQNTTVKIIGGPQEKDRLTWWQAETKDANGRTLKGWMTESASTGIHLEKVDDATIPSMPANKGNFKVGQSIVTTNFVRMRKTPGYFDKPNSDVIADLWQDTVGVVVDGPADEDELIWWRARMRDGDDRLVTGWIAETAPTGVTLLKSSDASTIDLNRSETEHKVGDLLIATTEIRVRSTPGRLNKPNTDVLGFYREQTTLNLLTVPEQKDELSWLRVGGISPNGELAGWVAERVNDVPLVGDAALLPGTGIPNREKNLYLGAPTRIPFGIAQLWGENPTFYKQFKPNGVPLLGHNGIDFLTPLGTDVIAADNGQVIHVGSESRGFGNWVLLQHTWGRSIYAHMNSVSVSFGQGVERGTFLGKSGNTGSSTGPHLHFAIARNPFHFGDGWGGYSDPLPYLPTEFVRLPAWVLKPSPSESVVPSGVLSTPAQLIPDRLEPSGVTVDMPE